jgi:parallel beta-helix repeat protein
MYGITLTATFSGGANGFNRITNNKINDFYTDGIHVIASYNTVIEKNTITRPTRTNTATTVNGIVFSAQNNGPIISKNKIYECI